MDGWMDVLDDLICCFGFTVLLRTAEIVVTVSGGGYGIST